MAERVKNSNEKISEKKLQITANKLQHKYSKKRTINVRALKTKTKTQKIFSIVFDIVCGLVVLITSVLCFSSLNSKIQNVCPTFAGYSNLTVKTGSMINSGLNIGDTVIVKTINTKTLHENDIIAFYVYHPDYDSFNVNTCIRIEDESIAPNQFVTNFSSLLGFQSSSLSNAAKHGGMLVIHHIKAIYQDDSGLRWFKTYGSSNLNEDVWYISENMVVGLLVRDGFAGLMSTVISTMSSDYGLVVILLPLLLLGAVVVAECVKDVQLAKLELDCVEEKRKITDPICVKNNVGFNMDEKTKFKVLAQASLEERNLYISLLWKTGELSSNIRKFYLRRDAILRYNQKMLELNRECEQMFKAGQKPTKVAKYYCQTKQKLAEEQRQRAKKLSLHYN